MDIMRQSAVLIVKQIKVYSYGIIFLLHDVVRPQTQVLPRPKTIIGGLVPDAMFSRGQP